MPSATSYRVPEQCSGLRLDKLLADLMADAGLRLRRRLCDEGRVLVDGRTRKPGYKVRPGQEVQIVKLSASQSMQDGGVRIIERSSLFAAVDKPGGMHSAAIDGKPDDNVERLLPSLFPDAPSAVLLNRLDYPTSGLLMVALDETGAAAYQRMEAAGEIRKFYLAVVRGRLDGMISVRRRLDTDNRKKTRVLSEDNEDSRRWTEVETLSHDHEHDTTLVRCLIMKGARHQIRAHLASLGHPLVGDPLYGDGEEGEVLHLHHHAIELPDFSAQSPAPFLP